MFGGINLNKFKIILIITFSIILIGCEKIDSDNSETINASNLKESKTDIINQEYLYIKSLDVNSGEEIVIGNLILDESSSLEEQLNTLIKEISKLSFDNAPIELVKIENNIAYINLKEGKDKNYWSTRYFQGSTGGNITTYTLKESILQKSYKGKWISGVQFSYEGKTDVEFDHIDVDFFGETINR